jgi:hypothetical protein
MSRPPRSCALLLALLPPLLASGCASDPTVGYAAVSPFPTSIESVAVPIVENDTFIRGIEFELTDALIKEIESRTPYKVTGRDRADSILLGRITSVRLDQLSKSRLTGLSEEVIVSVTIDFQWRDLRTDASLVERDAFSSPGLFTPSNPAGERIELGEFAAVQRLARDIVDEMRAAW